MTDSILLNKGVTKSLKVEVIIKKITKMNYSEIVQKVSSIDKCDEKDLALVLAEALEKVLHFENLCSKLVRPEGVINFYKHELPKLQGRLMSSSDFEKLANQTFIAMTDGMTFAELDSEINKRLGPASVGGSFMTLFMGTHTGPYGGNKIRLRNSENKAKFINSYAKEAEEYHRDLNMLTMDIEKSAVMLIPADFRYSLALETMLRFVRNYMASTWKECAKLYLEQFSRWKMEANSEENLRLQRDIRKYTRGTAKSATAAAIFSGLNLLLKL